MSFQNKVALITGASSGLGRRLAVELSQRGAKLSLFARNEAGLEATKLLCSTPSLLIQGDVTKPASCKQAVEKTLSTYGKLDYLILNAGISMWSRFDQVENPTIFQTLMETNYLGPVYFCHYALPELKKGKGMIVSISSIQGKVSVPYHSGYAASKHALQGFLDSLRTELSLDLLVVSPSWIEGTNLKDRAILRTSPRITHGKGLPLSYCAHEILSAMAKRKKELILPKKYQLLPWLKLIAPQFLHRLIRKKFSLDEFSRNQ